MSKFFSFCKTNNRKHNLKEQEMVQIKPRKSNGHGFYCLSWLLICLIFLTGLFYLFQITSNSTQGFQISEQEKKINELKLANENLRQNVNYFEDLNYIKTRASELGLVAVSDVEYLDVSSGGVVLK